MRKTLAATAFITLIATGAAPIVAQAPMAIPGAPDTSRVTAGTYTVDTGHTQVVFTLNHLGFTEYSGQFTQPTGTMTLDPAHPADTKIDISFPIDKVSTTVPALDEHLKKPDFFDAAQFPQGHFVSTKVSVRGNTATISGDLTLKGVTKPVVLATRFIGAGANPLNKRKTIGFAATTTIKRSDFGVSYGLPMVSDEVRLTINASFEMR